MKDTKEFRKKFEETRDKIYLVRDASLSMDNSEIMGVEIRHMTLKIYSDLCAMKSPFVVGGVITFMDIIEFIWMMDFDYMKKPDPDDDESNTKYTDGISSMVLKWSTNLTTENIKDLCREISDFIRYSLMDFGLEQFVGQELSKEDAIKKAKKEVLKVDKTTFWARAVFYISRVMGFDEESILNMPINRCGLYYKMCREFVDGDNWSCIQITERVVQAYRLQKQGYDIKDEDI